MLDSEKGDRFSPILMRFIDHTALQCTLNDLILHWHDVSGFCRASDQERRCLILMFDRHIEGLAQKCTQKIVITDDTIVFPCFIDTEGHISFQTFHIAAVTFHIGLGPHSGHHRVAIRYHGSWLVYDDNRLPDIIESLTNEILCNMTMVWLVHAAPIAARTMHERHDTGNSSGHSVNPGAVDSENLQRQTASASSAVCTLPSSATSPNQEMSKESEKVPDVNNPEDSLTRAPKRARQDSETTDL
jgi:hypothetical protein